MVYLIEAPVDEPLNGDAQCQQCQQDYNLRSIGCDTANARAPGNHILNHFGIYTRHQWWGGGRTN